MEYTRETLIKRLGEYVGILPSELHDIACEAVELLERFDCSKGIRLINLDDAIEIISDSMDATTEAVQRGKRGRGMSNIDIYIRDKELNIVRRVGDSHHDMLTINEHGQLCYRNLQNGGGCRTGEEPQDWYEFVPNEDRYGYNIDPRTVARIGGDDE